MPGGHQHQPATASPPRQDACGTVTITYSDSISNGCGGTKVVSRLWTATDACGNSTNAVQTITVRDTTAAALICARRYGRWSARRISAPPATAWPPRTDACGTATVTYSDSISNGCGGTKVVSRLWTATDACGNSTNAVQTITVRDTTPPALAVPANAMLECPADTSTNSTGIATALDACGEVLVSYSDVVSNGTGGTKIIARTWTATDACGNSTNGVQTIAVRDTTPPTITYALG